MPDELVAGKVVGVRLKMRPDGLVCPALHGKKGPQAVTDPFALVAYVARSFLTSAFGRGGRGGDEGLVRTRERNIQTN